MPRSHLTAHFKKFLTSYSPCPRNAERPPGFFTSVGANLMRLIKLQRRAKRLSAGPCRTSPPIPYRAANRATTRGRYPSTPCLRAILQQIVAMQLLNEPHLSLDLDDTHLAEGAYGSQCPVHRHDLLGRENLQWLREHPVVSTIDLGVRRHLLSAIPIHMEVRNLHRQV